MRSRRSAESCRSSRQQAEHRVPLALPQHPSASPRGRVLLPGMPEQILILVHAGLDAGAVPAWHSKLLGRLACKPPQRSKKPLPFRISGSSGPTCVKGASSERTNSRRAWSVAARPLQTAVFSGFRGPSPPLDSFANDPSHQQFLSAAYSRDQRCPSLPRLVSGGLASASQHRSRLYASAVCLVCWSPRRRFGT